MYILNAAKIMASMMIIISISYFYRYFSRKRRAYVYALEAARIVIFHHISLVREINGKHSFRSNYIINVMSVDVRLFFIYFTSSLNEKDNNQLSSYALP